MREKPAVASNIIYILGSVAFVLSLALPAYHRKRDGEIITPGITSTTLFSGLLYLASSMLALSHNFLYKNGMKAASTTTFLAGSALLEIEGLYRFRKNPEKLEPNLNLGACSLFLLSSALSFAKLLKNKSEDSAEERRETNLFYPLLRASGSCLFFTDAFLRKENATIITTFECFSSIFYIAANVIIMAAYFYKPKAPRETNENPAGYFSINTGP